MPDEPVRAMAAPLDVEAAREGPARFQDAEGLPVRRLLVREGVEAVEGENDVEGAVLKRQIYYYLNYYLNFQAELASYYY